MMDKNSRGIRLTVWKNQKRYEINANLGQNLRKTLIDNGLSPYSIINEKINCRGNGLCATCGVFFINTDQNPTHWHDRIAKAFSYPRLSCQIEIKEDLEIEIPKKMIWGKRRKIIK